MCLWSWSPGMSGFRSIKDLAALWKSKKLLQITGCDWMEVSLDGSKQVLTQERVTASFRYTHLWGGVLESDLKTIIEGQKTAETHANQRYQDLQNHANQRYQSLFEENMKLNHDVHKMVGEIDHMREEREATDMNLPIPKHLVLSLALQQTHTAWGGSSNTIMVAKAFGGVSASKLKLKLLGLSYRVTCCSTASTLAVESRPSSWLRCCARLHTVPSQSANPSAQQCFSNLPGLFAAKSARFSCQSL